MSKQKAIKVLKMVKEHYMNTLLVDDTDSENLKEVEEALQWAKSKKE